jgi:hypothetical protein
MNTLSNRGIRPMGTTYKCVNNTNDPVLQPCSLSSDEEVPDVIQDILHGLPYVVTESVTEKASHHELQALLYNGPANSWLYPSFAVVDGRVIITSIVVINGTYVPNIEWVLSVVECQLFAELPSN